MAWAMVSVATRSTMAEADSTDTPRRLGDMPIHRPDARFAIQRHLAAKELGSVQDPEDERRVPTRSDDRRRDRSRPGRARRPRSEAPREATPPRPP